MERGAKPKAIPGLNSELLFHFDGHGPPREKYSRPTDGRLPIPVYRSRSKGLGLALNYPMIRTTTSPEPRMATNIHGRLRCLIKKRLRGALKSRGKRVTAYGTLGNNGWEL
ncbi:hypothetical protein KM043_006624 [Ampulex compressa]|nr:hypothetical protein KM043_006624 [Ampulex compressa]